jgi:hypothetical protein
MILVKVNQWIFQGSKLEQVRLSRKLRIIRVVLEKTQQICSLMKNNIKRICQW